MAERQPIPHPMTLEAWSALGEDVPGELVDGLLEDEEVPSIVHELVVGLLWEQFRAWAGRGALVVPSEVKLAVASNIGRKPDLAVWCVGTRLPAPDASLARVPPDVVVEVITPTPRDARRDRVAKHDEYAAFGIRFYWLVDPTLRSVEVFALRDGVYARVLGATAGAALPVPGFDGRTLDLDALWAEVDALVQRYEAQQGS